MVITLVVVSAILLVALVFRFVQPQILYGVSRVLRETRANKAALDYEAGRSVASHELAAVLMSDGRAETEELGAVEARRRANKIRELYRILDPRIAFTGRRDNPSICIVELAELVRSLAPRMRPSIENNRAVVTAGNLLSHICGTVRRADGFKRDLSEDDLGEWYIKNPVSMEQVVELLISIVESISFRLQAEEEKGGALEGTYSVMDLISRLERRLRAVVRSNYLSAQPPIILEERIKENLGREDYNQCTHRMQLSRSGGDVYLDFVDFLSLRHLERIIVKDWTLFEPLLEDRQWFTTRMEHIITARNVLFHGREVEEGEEEIRRLCNEVDERVWRAFG